MTVVELLSRTPIENVISTLANTPETVVFVGKCSKLKAFAPVFERFLAATGNHVTHAEYRGILSQHLNAIVDALEAIVQEYPDCQFDLTGGNDLSLTAIGIIYERYRAQGVKLHRYNVRTGRVYDCDMDGVTASDAIPALTVEQNIILHGGGIVPCEGLTDGESAWTIDGEFAADIRAMWNICRQDCASWNVQIGILANMRSFAGAAGTGLDVVLSVPCYKEYLKKTRLPYNLDRLEILASLKCAGVLTELENDGETLRFAFKSEQIKRCLFKSGTLLELYIYLLAQELTDECGKRFYTDAMTGVFIDWDGVIHTGSEHQTDTENEIDVVLMHGLVPVFISCKNGAVGEDELYKLHTVAERFGDSYAKCVLIGTTFGKAGQISKQYLLERAANLNIRVIEGVHEMTEDALKGKLKTLVP